MKKKVMALIAAMTLAGATCQAQAAQVEEVAQTGETVQSEGEAQTGETVQSEGEAQTEQKQFDIGEAILINNMGELETVGSVSVYDAHPFTDVSGSAWYAAAVEYVYSNNIMSGVGNNRFEPEGNTSRAMVVQILYNAQGKPEVILSNRFTDVSSGAWYAKAVEWAVQNGITSGVSANSFAPDREVTRQEVACFLYQYANLKGKDVKGRNDLSGFSDSGQIAAWALQPMQWANNVGIISGTGEGTLKPGGNATRAEIASMMQRFMSKGSSEVTQLTYEEQVVALVNQERAKENLPPLTMTEPLKMVAGIRAKETSEVFSHTRPNGTRCFTILDEYEIPYGWAGENIAYGYPTPESVVNGWMNSSGHRANILNSNFNHIGVGYYLKGSTAFWVQLFTS